MSSPEHKTQNEIRNALAGKLPLFRINAGRGWTGNKIVKLADGSMLIKDPRPFDAGVPVGFSDTFGVLPVTITDDMVGQTIGQAVFGEVKAEGGKVAPAQAAFLKAMKNQGARADVWRSVSDALKTISGG
jgi:hypothetical protein